MEMGAGVAGEKDRGGRLVVEEEKSDEKGRQKEAGRKLTSRN